MTSTAWRPVVPSHFLRTGENIVAGFCNGQELALWRSEAGDVHAWENRCPHRGTRLTLGRIINDRLSCAYHGWQFSAGNGKCVAIPAHPDLPPPKNVGAKAFPIAEVDGMVWVADAADGQRESVTPTDKPKAFLRSVGVRTSQVELERELVRKRFEQVSVGVWQGQLASLPTEMQLNEVSAILTLAHIWILDPHLATDKQGSALAATRSLRRDAEHSIAQRRPQ